MGIFTVYTRLEQGLKISQKSICESQISKPFVQLRIKVFWIITLKVPEQAKWARCAYIPNKPFNSSGTSGTGPPPLVRSPEIGTLSMRCCFRCNFPPYANTRSFRPAQRNLSCRKLVTPPNVEGTKVGLAPSKHNFGQKESSTSRYNVDGTVSVPSIGLYKPCTNLLGTVPYILTPN